MAKTKRKQSKKRNRSLRKHQSGGNILDQIKGFRNSITNFLTKSKNKAEETQKKFSNAQECVSNCYKEFGSPDSDPKPAEQPKPMEPMEQPEPVEQSNPVVKEFNNPLQKTEDEKEDKKDDKKDESVALLTGGKRNKRKHKKKTKKRKKVKRKITYKKRKRR